jgi:site-specific DNA recombinase
MADPEKNRAALYARVSTDEQAQEGYSLDAQMATMRTFCEIHDLIIAGEYVDDGYSATNTRRKAYRQMFEDRKGWDVLVVLKMDRIHRNSKNFMIMMEDLRKHGQEFISTYDKINTSTAVGRFAMDMIQRIAQLESEQIGERTYMGMKEKAETGQGILGFTPPYGYGLRDGSLYADENESPVARSIFDSYLSGCTMDEIAFSFNCDGTLTRKGNAWNKYNLRTILHNPIYAGYMRWDGILQKHDGPALVTPQEFNRVQTMMADKVRDPSKKDVFLLEIING